MFRRRRRRVSRFFLIGALFVSLGASWLLGYVPFVAENRPGTSASDSQLPEAIEMPLSPQDAPRIPEQEVAVAKADVPLPAPGPRPVRAPVVNYILRDGDTLLDLADRFDTTVEKLQQYNLGLDPSGMQVGRLIKVPDKLAERGEIRPLFIWPSRGPITTPFGVRGSDWVGGYHPGLDIGSNAGDFVWAADNGIIISTGTDGLGRGYGTYILMYHYDGWLTLYAHLSKVYRSLEYFARAGEPIGEVGTTGYSYGPHLHFEVWRNGDRQDPIQFLP